MIIPWGKQSKAFERSMKAAPIVWLRSRDTFQSSMALIRVYWQLHFLRTAHKKYQNIGSNMKGDITEIINKNIGYKLVVDDNLVIFL